MNYIMHDFAQRYQDSIQYIIKINYLKSELDKKINHINKLKKHNSSIKPEYYVNKIVRERQIKKLESELFTGA